MKGNIAIPLFSATYFEIFVINAVSDASFWY